jgi:hypothetical protein
VLLARAMREPIYNGWWKARANVHGSPARYWQKQRAQIAKDGGEAEMGQEEER